MEYEDRIAISTPEGIEIQYTLAGLASRGVAAIIDLLVKAAVVLAVLAILAGVDASSQAVAVAVTVTSFVVLFVYDVAFEVWGGGCTPGKRLSGLRVVTAGGHPVELAASGVRRLLWLIDAPVTVFIVGTVAILVTEHNQRLGDLAAGTVVVREELRSIDPIAAASAPSPVSIPSDATSVDVTEISPTELAAVRDFLARRSSLPTDARIRVARRLAGALEPKVGGLPPGGLQAEQLLEAIAAMKR